MATKTNPFIVTGKEYTVIFRQYKLRFVGSDGVQRLSYV